MAYNKVGTEKMEYNLTSLEDNDPVEQNTKTPKLVKKEGITYTKIS